MLAGFIKQITIITLLIISTSSFVCASQGEELSQRQLEIVQIVLSPDGYITEGLHSEFWSLAPAKIAYDERKRNLFLTLMKEQFVYAIQFQRESWASMKASLEAGRISKTAQYSYVKSQIISVAPPEAKRQIRQSINNAEGMIKAAATKSPFQSARGTFYITHELVDRVLAGLDGSFARANQLINPTWSPRIQEYIYPEAHVSVLSSAPFSSENKEITTHEGKSVEMTMLTRVVDEHNMLLMSYYRIPKALDSQSILRIARSTITGSGASPSGTYSTSWRDMVSALSTGIGKNSDGTFYVSTRAVALDGIKAVFTIMSVSTISKSEANLLREQLESSIQIMN